MENTEKKQTLKTNPAFVVQLRNNGMAELADSVYASNELYRLKSHTVKGIDGKGKESVNVSLAKAENIADEIIPEIIEVKGKDISLKLGFLSKGKEKNEEKYSIVYDNYTKNIAGIYKQTDGKVTEIDKNGYFIEPDKKLGSSAEERISVVDGLIMFVKEGMKTANANIRGLFIESLNSAKGDLKAKGIIKNNKFDITTIYGKTEFLKDILGRIDFDNPSIKSFYKDFRDKLEEEKEISIPKITVFLKDKENFLNFLNEISIKGIKFSDFRKLTKTENMVDKNDPEEKALFDAIQKLKKELNIKTDIRNANVRNIGIDNNGNIAVLEDNALKIPSNGQIYTQLELYDKLKDIEWANNVIQNGIWNAEDRGNNVSDEDFLKAENILKEKAMPFIDKEQNDKIKSFLNETVKSLDINQLKDTDYKNRFTMKKKFEEVFNYVKKNIYLQTRDKVIANMDLFTQDKSRIKNLPFASKQKEALFDADGLDGKYMKDNIREYAVVANIPVISRFEDTLYTKNVAAKAFSVYYDTKEDRIRQIEPGANISNYKNILNLGKMIDNVRNYSPDDENLKKLVENGLDAGFSKYFYLNKDDESIQTSQNFQKVVELVKPELSKLVSLLKEKKYNEAKEFVNGWDNNDKIKTFAEWTKKAANTYTRNKMLNQMYFNIKNEKVQEVLKMPFEELLNNKELFINSKDLSNRRKTIRDFIKNFDINRKTVEMVKQKDIETLYENNGEIDEKRLKYNTVESRAQNLAYSLSNHPNMYYLDKNKNIHIHITFKPFQKTEGDLIEKVPVEFKGKEVYVSKLNKDKFNKFEEKKKQIKNEVKEIVDKQFEEIDETVNQNLSHSKPKKQEGAIISFDDVDLGDVLEEKKEDEITADDIKINKTDLSENTNEEKDVSFPVAEDYGDFGIDEEENPLTPEDVVSEDEKKIKNIKEARTVGL